MAFDMGKISARIKTTKKTEKHRAIASLFVYIDELDNVSDRVKKILELYLSSRLKVRGSSCLTIVKLNNMITELLEKCCGKPYMQITPEDTDNNFDEILYQIKNAILNKYKFKIYSDIDKNKVSDVMKNTDDKLYKNKYNKTITDAELEELFKGWVEI